MEKRGTSTADVVEFLGHRYRRYPNSKHEHHRRYWHGTEPRRGFLHRHIWEHHHQRKIPKGWDVHHKDENTLNNHISNLEILPLQEHRALHLGKRSRTPEHLARLDKIRPMASAWHGSPEGISWHREICLKNC